MTEHRLFEHFQNRLGSTVKAEDKLFVNQALIDAEATALSYTGRGEIRQGMENAVVALAIVFYNRIGDEGETSRSEGGISRSFEVGIPEDIRAMLSAYVKVGTV